MVQDKKILNQGPFSGIAVPIAIVLIGALIIFGVTKMLSTGKDHRDLVQELNSKTFGNRWVSAYELSKYLANSKIPKEDIPWVVENLIQTYKESPDARTRNFVVLAVGILDDTQVVPFLNEALKDPDSQVKFNALVNLGNKPQGSSIAWQTVKEIFAQTDDAGLKQVALFSMASHGVSDFVNLALPLLNSSERMLRYSAATALIHAKNPEAIAILSEILFLPYGVAKEGELNAAQIATLKENILEIASKVRWTELESLIKKVSDEDSNQRVATKAKQALNLLKN